MNIEKIGRALGKEFPGLRLETSMDERGILSLRGDCSDWRQVVDVGHFAAKLEGVRNVVNKCTAAGVAPPRPDYESIRRAGEKLGVIDEVDVLIIGAGVSGCGIARELSKYKLDILVVDKGEDVATGATKANNGNIHPGHAAKPGSLKARLNIEGNRRYTQWAEELGFELQRSGAMGFVTERVLVPAMRPALKAAQKNGVDGVEMVDGKRACQLEPGLERNGFTPKSIKAAVWLPSMGLVEPYKVTVALAENAAQNGVRFLLNCEVAGILHKDGAVQGAVTSRGTIHAKYIINCAGVYADEMSALAGDECFTIHPRKGVIAILDKATRPLYDCVAEHYTVASVKRAMQNKKNETKGGGMCRTPEWNVLMGPSATEIPDKEDLSTLPSDLQYAMGRGSVAYGDIIRFFAGNRPADYSEDFVIGMSDITAGFINVGGIQSPGLAAAPAIAGMVEGILADAAEQAGQPLQKDENWDPIRPREVEFRHLSRREQDELIRKNPAYGRVVCRCESITEGEILDAIKSPVVPASIDAIKRRTRAGMGRCQGGFCQPRVLEILARELGKDWLDITLKGEGTSILARSNRPPTVAATGDRAQAGAEEERA